MRFLFGLILCGSLAFLGCSSDDNNAGGDGGSAGAGGSAGGGGSAGAGGMGGGGGEAGMGGQGGVGGMSAAKSFCESYGTICGFDSGGFANAGECETAYDGFGADRQACIEMHLGFADGGDTATHCPHAAGEAPCN